MRKVDTSCNSEFMERVMPEVVEAIHNEHHYVDFDTPIYLFLDNTGGCGTNEAVDKYVANFKSKYNIICIHQRPQLPATNMLNLGVWMALKSWSRSSAFTSDRS